MFELFLFISAFIISIYLISKKIETEKSENFEDRDN